jgi:UDP-3-O-[3-hydroxymyristoyl] glucosamine N-acyltransferase
VHSLASVAADARVDPTATISAFAVVGSGASIGARTVVHPHVVIGDGTTIGPDCIVHAHVSIRERCTIGARVILQNGAVIGSDGYGFAPRADGTHEKIPQTAPVVIEDDVEIGANTTIDRPAVGETRIKAGTKIDNLVQIAHGVVLGKNVLLAAQVGIAGSTVIGDGVQFGGQVGVGGHLTIGSGAIVVGQSGVTNSLEPGDVVAGYPAIDSREWRKASVIFRRLPELKRRIEELEARLDELTGQTLKPKSTTE